MQFILFNVINIQMKVSLRRPILVRKFIYSKSELGGLDNVGLSQIKTKGISKKEKNSVEYYFVTSLTL